MAYGGGWSGAGLVAALLGLAAPAPLVACGAQSDCAAPGGSYRIWTPDAARDAKPVGAILYLHGYRGSPQEIMNFAALRDVARDLGVALIAPAGQDGAWNLPGVQPGGRDDLAFIAAVRDDATERFAIDPARIVVSGFSLGASMAWYVACAQGRDFAGYAPIAGSFWEPYVADCRTPLPAIHHVHGRADPMVPLEGRALSFATQGDTLRSFALLRSFAGCSGDLAGEVRDDKLTCARQVCGGAVQELCLHDGGHSVEPAWIARAWREIGTDRGPD